MNRRLFPSILLTALFAGLGTVGSGQSKSGENISPLIERIIKDAGIPGAVAIVLRGDRILAEGVAGVRKRGSDVEVTLDDQFEIASCTKAMTATLVASLVAEKRLSWNTTLGDIWADATAPIDPA